MDTRHVYEIDVANHKVIRKEDGENYGIPGNVSTEIYFFVGNPKGGPEKNIETVTIDRLTGLYAKQNQILDVHGNLISTMIVYGACGSLQPKF